MSMFQIVDWLLLPKDARPGLITAYLDQPDSAGHYQVDDRDVSWGGRAAQEEGFLERTTSR